MTLVFVAMHHFSACILLKELRLKTKSLMLNVSVRAADSVYVALNGI